METMFWGFFNRSIAAGWLILAILLLRTLFRRAPRSFFLWLWAMTACRLCVPHVPQSPLSLLPRDESVSLISAPVETTLPFVSGNAGMTTLTAHADGMIAIDVATIVWLIGLSALLLYAAIGYGRVRRAVREAVPLWDNVWQCDRIRTPFVLGVLRPRIYLPSALPSEHAASVLAHERAHLRRHDHWWKPLGYGLLTVYWFHPLLWVAYAAFCRDMERACDERVVRPLSVDGKRAYARALIACSAPLRPAVAPPLAFSETDVRQRIRAILHYKKPAFWVVIAAVAVCLAVAVGFLTDPKSAPSSAADAPAAAMSSGTATSSSAAVSLETANGLTVFYRAATAERDEPTLARYLYWDEAEMRRALEPLRTAQWYNDAAIDRLTLHFDGRLYCDGWLYFSYTEQTLLYDSGGDSYLTALPDELRRTLQELSSRAAAVS